MPMPETDIAQVIEDVADDLTNYFAELDDEADTEPFGECPQVSAVGGGGGTFRRWFTVRHQDGEGPAIRVTIEEEAP